MTAMPLLHRPLPGCERPEHRSQGTRCRKALQPRCPHGPLAGLGRISRLRQHAEHVPIAVKLIVRLAVEDVAVDLRPNDGWTRGRPQDLECQ